MVPKLRPRPLRGSDIAPKTSPLPPPPRIPYIWTWTRHECRSEFPLSCTRRCLYCSHQLCTTPSGENKGKRCTSEFDYTGWAAWGAYRRSAAAVQAGATGIGHEDKNKSRKRKRISKSEPATHDTFATWELTTSQSHTRHGPAIQSRVWQPLPEAELEEVSRRKEELYIQERHKCQFHCDFPSECLHTLHNAWAEGRIRSMRERERPSRQVYDDSQPRPKKKKKKGELRVEGVSGVQRSSGLRNCESSSPLDP